MCFDALGINELFGMRNISSSIEGLDELETLKTRFIISLREMMASVLFDLSPLQGK